MSRPVGVLLMTYGSPSSEEAGLAFARIESLNTDAGLIDALVAVADELAAPAPV